MTTANERAVQIALEDRPPVSGHWLIPPAPRVTVALAHGAGNDMSHAFMCRAQAMFCALGAACLRFNFPYKEAGRNAPDRPNVLQATWRAAIHHAREQFPSVPLVAGGKSMGGRIASMVASSDQSVDGLVLLGYPLHPAGKPERERAEHFPDIRVPCLFVQGDRDRLCDLNRLRDHLPRLSGEATLHVIPQGDHSFKVPKRSGVSEDAVWDAMATASARWLDALIVD